MFESVVPLWPEDTRNNNFVYYVVGGIGLVYLVSLLITIFTRRTRSAIVVVPPVEECESESLLHKYLLVVNTSSLPGCGCSDMGKTFIKIVGEDKESKYHEIHVFTYGRFLFQRGSTDILLFKVRGNLGSIQKVKIIAVGTENLRWKINETEVIKVSTDERWVVPHTLIHEEKVDEDPDRVLHHSRQRHSLLIMVLKYHQWTSSFFIPLRYGAYTNVVHVLMLFCGLTLMTVGTLIGYIITPQYDTLDVFTLNWSHVLYTGVTSSIIGIFLGGMKMVLHEVKSGSEKKIQQFISTLKEEKERNYIDKIKKSCQPSPYSGSIYNNLEEGKIHHRDEENHPLFFSAQSVGNYEEFDDEHYYSIPDTTRKFTSATSKLSYPSTDGSLYESSVHVDKSSVNPFTSIDEMTPIPQEHSSTRYYSLHGIEKWDSAHEEYLEEPFLDTLPSGHYDDKHNRALQSVTCNISEDRTCSVPEMLIKTEVLSGDVTGQSSMQEKTEQREPGNFGNVKSVPLDQETKDFDIDEDLLSLPVHVSDSQFAGREAKIGDRGSRPSAIKESRQGKRSYQYVWFSVRKQLKILEGSRKVGVESFANHFLQEIEELIKNTMDDILVQKYDECQQSLNENVTNLCSKMEEQLFTQLGHLHNVERLIEGERMLSIIEAPPELMTIAASMTKTFVDDVARRLEQQSTMRVADRQELVYNIMKKILSFNAGDYKENNLSEIRKSDSTDSRHSTDEAKPSPYGEHLGVEEGDSAQNVDTEAEIDDHLSVIVAENSPEIDSLIAVFIEKGLNRAFHSTFGEKISIDNKSIQKFQEKDSLKSMISNLFKGKTAELLAIKNFSREVIHRAQEELMEEYMDPVSVYVEILIKQIVLRDLNKMAGGSKLQDLQEKFKTVIHKLQRRWHREGFHKSLHAGRNLAKVILTGHLKETTENCSKGGNLSYNALNNLSTIKRLENRIYKELMQKAEEVISTMGTNSRTERKAMWALLSKDDGHQAIILHVCLKTELAVQRLKPFLPEIACSVISNEMMQLNAAAVVQDVISNARHNVLLEAQVVEYQDFDVLSMDEEETQELISDIKPLKSYLRYVTYDENYRKQRDVQEDYFQKAETKHKKFAMTNLQTFLDSFDILDEDSTDRTVTDKVLYEMEWNALHENKKPLPRTLKVLLGWFMFCGTIFNLYYMGEVGAQLTTLEVQEWCCCLLIGLCVFGLFLEPLSAIVVGKMQERFHTVKK